MTALLGIALIISLVALAAVVALLVRANRGDDEDTLADRFKAQASDVLGEATQRLLAQNRELREADQQQAEAILREREREFQRLTEGIEKGQLRIEEEVKRRGETDQATRALLDQMRVGVEGLSTETAGLKKALRQPQTRGRWGEVQLKRCVEIAGMTEHVDYELQLTLKEDGVWLRPDAVFKLPGERTVVADSKVPLDAYLEAIEADGDGARKSELVRHSRQVREHIRSLGSKRYQDQFKSGETPDFVVCFFPSEPALHAAFEVDPGLYEQAFNDSVLIATPTTLIGLLRTIELGWRQETISEEAKQIAEAARILHGRFAPFLSELAKLGRQLDSATGAYSAAIGSLEGRLLPQLRRIEDLGASSGKELEVPGPVEGNVRPIAAPELHAGDGDAELPHGGSAAASGPGAEAA